MTEDQLEKLIRLEYEMQYSHCPLVAKSCSIWVVATSIARLKSMMLIISSQSMLKMRGLMSYNPAYGTKMLSQKYHFLPLHSTINSEVF